MWFGQYTLIWGWSFQGKLHGSGFRVTLKFFLIYQVFEFPVFIYTRSFIVEMGYVVFIGVHVCLSTNHFVIELELEPQFLDALCCFSSPYLSYFSLLGLIFIAQSWRLSSDLWFSKCSPQTSSNSVTWQLVRNARSWAPP